MTLIRSLLTTIACGIEPGEARLEGCSTVDLFNRRKDPADAVFEVRSVMLDEKLYRPILIRTWPALKITSIHWMKKFTSLKTPAMFFQSMDSIISSSIAHRTWEL